MAGGGRVMQVRSVRRGWIDMGDEQDIASNPSFLGRPEYGVA